MRPVVRAGRWVWGLCGLITATAIAIPGTLLIVSAGEPAPAKPSASHQAQFKMVQTQTRTVTVSQPVTSLNVQDYAGLIQVTAAPVGHVEIIETLAYYGTPPAVTQSVSDGLLSLANPACANRSCSVSFTVRVPPSVTITATGGAMFISGIAGANLDSDGAPVSASNIHGPLTVSTHGGPLQITGLTGPLHADTGGGSAVATRLTATTATVTTGGGMAQLAFAAAPESVTVSTDRAPVSLAVPGGPYALTANSDGAPQIIGIATSSAASRSITVSTGGGQLTISSRDPGNLLQPPLTTSGPRQFHVTVLGSMQPITRRATGAASVPAAWFAENHLPASMILTCAAERSQAQVEHAHQAVAVGHGVLLCRPH